MSPALVASKAALEALGNKIEQKWAPAMRRPRAEHHTAGRPPEPSSTRLVPLTRHQSTAYDAVAAQFRWIEQEAIPLPRAAARLEALISTRS